MLRGPRESRATLRFRHGVPASPGPGVGVSRSPRLPPRPTGVLHVAPSPPPVLSLDGAATPDGRWLTSLYRQRMRTRLATEVDLAALILLLRARFRHQWRSRLVLCLLIALVSGLVLAGAAAARSTGDAFSRFEAADGYDALAYIDEPTPKIARLPEVASAAPVGVIAAGVAPICSCSRPINANYFQVSEVPPGDLSHMVKLVAGRMPDQSAPDQALASFTLEQDGVHIGTTIRLPLWSPSQIWCVLSGANVKPDGPRRSPSCGWGHPRPTESSSPLPTPPSTTSTPPTLSLRGSTPRRGASWSTLSASAMALKPSRPPSTGRAAGSHLLHRSRRQCGGNDILESPPGRRLVGPHHPGRPGRGHRCSPSAGASRRHRC